MAQQGVHEEEVVGDAVHLDLVSTSNIRTSISTPRGQHLTIRTEGQRPHTFGVVVEFDLSKKVLRKKRGDNVHGS